VPGGIPVGLAVVVASEVIILYLIES
jgi:hypothetical protein